MRKIREVPGFTIIDSLLDRSLGLAKESLELRIKAAKKLAKQLMENCIEDDSLRVLLEIPAFNDDPSRFVYTILGDQMPTMSLLEQIICIGIQQSQDPDTDGQVTQALVGIKKTDLEKIGYIPGKKFNEEFDKISRCTKGFIRISPHSVSIRTDVFVFLSCCNFWLRFPKEEIPA